MTSALEGGGSRKVVKSTDKLRDHALSWSKRLECFAKQDPGRARQSS